MFEHVLSDIKNVSAFAFHYSLKNSFLKYPFFNSIIITNEKREISFTKNEYFESNFWENV